MIPSIRAVTDSSAQRVTEGACGIEARAEPLASFNPAGEDAKATCEARQLRAAQPSISSTWLYDLVLTQNFLCVSKGQVVVCKIKDDGRRLVPPFSVSRLHAAKRPHAGICKLEKLHDRSPPYHQCRTSREHRESLKRYVRPGLHSGMDLCGTERVRSSLRAAGRGALFTANRLPS